ncbi:G5 domain-containing protein [bacterium]|nr:G5 domain-containing protein [bacterium]
MKGVKKISQQIKYREIFSIILIVCGFIFLSYEFSFLKIRIEEINKTKKLLEGKEVFYISERAKFEVSKENISVKSAKVNVPYKKEFSLALARWHLEKERKQIPFAAYRKYTTSIPYGATRTEPGKPGEVEIYWRVYKRGNRILDKQKFKEVVISRPKPQIVYIGRGYMLASRGQFAGKPYLDMIATAYDPGPRSCGTYADGYTSIGLKAGYGVVAVDPSVIPLGKKLYIEGYGYAIAGDVGRAIKGLRIDLGFDTYREAINFGVRKVRVYILN